MASTQNSEADIRDHLKFSFKTGNFDGLMNAKPDYRLKDKCGCDCDTCTVIFDRVATVLTGVQS